MPRRATDEERLCDILLRTGSLRFGSFKLASGMLSPYYVDLRLIPSDPSAFRTVISFYSSIIDGALRKRTKRLAGIPTAGMAYAAVLAFSLNKPFLYVRREEKAHGRGRRIEGILQPGDRVLILDDVITTGKNIMDAADAIRAEGGIVEDAAVLLDREQGGEAALRRTGVRLHAFTKIRRVVNNLSSRGLIDESQRKEIVSQVVG